MEEREKQIKDIISPHLVTLSYLLCKTQPKDVVGFMIDYFKKEFGYTNTGLTVDEKKELELLRQEVKDYRKREEAYLSHGSNLYMSDNEDEEKDLITLSENDNQHNNVIITHKPKRLNNKRISISAEVYGVHNKQRQFIPKKIPKTKEQISRIKMIILSSFIFSTLDTNDLNIVTDSMEEINVKAGDIVINQGDDGNCLYIVEKGELDCYKSFPNKNQQYNSDKHFQTNNGNNQGKQNNSYFSMNANSNQGSSSSLQNRTGKQQLALVYLKTYTSGDAFGELALLYNTPRAATISAKTDAILWSLDRETFTHIVKASTQQKREKNKEFLKHVDILSNLGEDELLQIQDSIKPGLYHKGDYIIREGEMGDVFYILEEGTCVALKTIEPGKPPIEVKQYTLGEYFGERALIKGEPRYSSIVATSDTVIVLSLDRFSFNRLLGPIEDLLKRNIEKYKTYCVNEKESENEVNVCSSENQIHLENEIDSKLVEVEDHLKFPEELAKNINTVIESYQQEQEPQPKHFEEVPEPTFHSLSPPEEMQLSQDDNNIIKEGEINKENNQQMVLQSMGLIEGEFQEL